MKLLILTQKVDINDDLLGFMHGWIIEFAKHCDKLTVICLQEGEHNLSDNVKVLSLGKEENNFQFFSPRMIRLGRTISNFQSIFNFQFFKKPRYLWNFYKYIWRERRNYDSVFVHMNKEYVLLGGLLWKLWNKKILLWYNHSYGNLFAVMAAKLADVVFYASPFSFMARYAKARQMPAGIDTDKLKVKNSPPNPPRADRAQKLKVKNSILFLGRIAPVKNLHILIKAAELLNKKGIDFLLNIVGEPGENDKDYFLKIKEMAKELEEKRKIKFLGNVPNEKTPEIYGSNEIFINLTNSGSLDKTTLEAMSCETTAIVCNESYKNIFPTEWHSLLIFKENDETDLAEKIIKFLNLDEAKKKEIGQKSREIAVKNHSLKNLIEKILLFLQYD